MAAWLGGLVMWSWGALWFFSNPLCSASSHHQLLNRVSLVVCSALGMAEQQFPPWAGEWAQGWAAGQHGGELRCSGPGWSRAVLPLASLTPHTNRDIISAVRAADSDALPDAGKGVPVVANSKEWLKKKKKKASLWLWMMTTHSSLFWSKTNFLLLLFSSLCFPIWWEFVSQLGAQSVCYWCASYNFYVPPIFLFYILSNDLWKVKFSQPNLRSYARASSPELHYKPCTFKMHVHG